VPFGPDKYDYTPGSREFYHTFIKMVQNTHVFIFCFNVCDARDLEDVESKWWNMVRAHAPSWSTRVMLGLKIDDVANRVVSRAEAEQVARDLDMHYFEASGASGEGVDEVMMNVIRLTFRKMVMEGKRDLITAKQVPVEQKGWFSRFMNSLLF
jgi:GTPase SAR1 family protein